MKGMRTPQVRIIAEFRTQTSLSEGCNVILRHDCLVLAQVGRDTLIDGLPLSSWSLLYTSRAAGRHSLVGFAVRQPCHRDMLITAKCFFSCTQRMYKEVQRALRSLFVRSRVAAAQQQQPEWQLQQQPLGTRSAVRETDLPAALEDGSFDSGDSGGGSDGGRVGSVSGGLAAAESAAQVPCCYEHVPPTRSPSKF